MLPILAKVSAVLFKNGLKKLGSLVAGGGETARQGMKLIGNIVGQDIDSPNIAAALNKTENVKLLADFEKEGMGEITKRHSADMRSDSILSKNIRPFTLLVLTILLAYGAVFDMGIYKFEKICDLNLYVYGFYFMARSIDKVRSSKKGTGGFLDKVFTKK